MSIDYKFWKSQAEELEKEAIEFDKAGQDDKAQDCWQKSQFHWEMAISLVNRSCQGKEYADEVFRCSNRSSRCFIEAIISKRRHNRKVCDTLAIS